MMKMMKGGKGGKGARVGMTRGVKRSVAKIPTGGGLTMDVVSQIQSVLASEGALALGKVTRMFPGTSKSSLEAHFVFSAGQNPMMSLPGQQGFPAQTFPRGVPKMTKEARIQMLRQSDSVNQGEKIMQLRNKHKFGPSLDPNTVARLEQYLATHGGTATMGNLSQEFRGLKKSQLQEHFKIDEFGQHQFTISSWNGAAPHDLSAFPTRPFGQQGMGMAGRFGKSAGGPAFKKPNTKGYF